MFNARVHYTVLTQHPNHTQPTHTVSTRIMVRHTKKGDNAPDTQQCTNIQTNYFYYCAQTPCVTKRHSNTWPCLKRCVFHPDNFYNNKVGSMTLAYSTNQGCNCTRIIKLLRKEVIHPHLPVRVPCYDFVPIADPTFDGSLTSLGHRLRVLPTFMT